ncbi:hypothetical protein F5X98DRAFT_357193 [Xylaria grammica]|nr:hypothetical protein F5X98DRAFT_357193 [Xylaria grammica]
MAAGNSWWDDFSNNLATDLAPLVALFGEAPTKQYLSECLTPEDIIIFAIAPLGIITAVVSAIRVRGTPSLRAFVGRAQEGAGTAEAELCSSTSRDVCELYSNGGIARVFGRPKLLEVVHDPLAPLEEFSLGNVSKGTAAIYSFGDYREKDRGNQEWAVRQGSWGRRKKYSEPNERADDQKAAARFAPNPNLSINIGIKPLARGWFLAAAAVGLMMQSFVLIWATITRYHYRWLKDSREDVYAIPLTLIGTVLLSLGMALCAYSIESKTKEQAYQRAQKSAARDQSKMYWVQPGNQIIGDQVFDSFAYSDAKHPIQTYITSWKDERGGFHMGWIWTAVITTALGFGFQFLGLRACHSSVAVAQLGVTILMSLVRSTLKSQRLRIEDNLMGISPDLFQGHELDYLALEIGRSPEATDVKASASKRTTAGDSAYSSETQSRSVWKVFSTPKSNEAEIAVRDCVDISSSPSESGGDNFVVLESLLPMSKGPPPLFGFRIKAQRPEIASTGLAQGSDNELHRWISRKHGATHQGNLNAVVKATLYRSRLARMTGLEEPESGSSSYWGTKFVFVRNTAIILAHAIEDTMQILFTSKSDAPTILHKSWEHAFRIFWTVQSSLRDPSMQNRRQDSDINMSLRREVDNDGAPQGPWKSDRSELEAVLGLWLWSLKKPQNGLHEDMNSNRVNMHISRILSTHQDRILDLDIWRGRCGAKIQKRRLKVPAKVANIARRENSFEMKENVSEGGHNQFHHAMFGWDGTISCPQAQNSVWWKDDEAFVTDPTGPHEHSHDQRRFFGWYNISDFSPGDYVDILEMTSENSLLLNCAQEMYCIFLTAITEAVENIGGHVEAMPYKDGFTVSNDNIDAIIRALIIRGLCDAEDAFACVIPVLRQQNKLEYSMAGDMVDRYRQQQNWGKTKEFINWMIGYLYARVYSRSDNKDPVTTSKVANDLRLSLVQACEIYRQALLQDNDQEREFGCRGILDLLEKYSKDEMIINMAATWVDSGTLPPTPSSDNHTRNLVDVLWSYGEAMMRCEVNKSYLRRVRTARWRRLGGNDLTPRPTSNNLLRAIEGGDLSSTLYNLQRDHLHRRENSLAVRHASELGWWMVVEALIKLGAAVNHKDSNTRNALSRGGVDRS